MSKRTTTCNCGCNKPKEVLTTTQLENQTVLNPENLENKDKILVLSKNVNNAYRGKVMSTLTVNDLVKAIGNPEVAFLMVEMKEPAAPVEPEPENPGTTTPDTPKEPDMGNGGTDPENPDTEGEGSEEGSGKDGEDGEGGTV